MKFIITIEYDTSADPVMAAKSAIEVILHIAKETKAMESEGLKLIGIVRQE